MIAWHDLAVFSASSLAMEKERLLKYITLEEPAQEKTVLPSLCVQSTIEETLAYMDLEEKHLKKFIKQQKKNC